MQPCHVPEMPGNQERVKAQGYGEAQGWTLSVLARSPYTESEKPQKLNQKSKKIPSYGNPRSPARQQPTEMEAIATLWSL